MYPDWKNTLREKNGNFLFVWPDWIMFFDNVSSGMRDGKDWESLSWHSSQSKLRPFWNFDRSDSACLKIYPHIGLDCHNPHSIILLWKLWRPFSLSPQIGFDQHLPEKVSTFIFIMSYPIPRSITRLFPPHNTWLPSILWLETIPAFSASSGCILELFAIDFKITFRHIDPKYAEIVTQSVFSVVTSVPWATPESLLEGVPETLLAISRLCTIFLRIVLELHVETDGARNCVQDRAYLLPLALTSICLPPSIQV
jgi:hypothetical protein